MTMMREIDTENIGTAVGRSQAVAELAMYVAEVGLEDELGREPKGNETASGAITALLLAACVLLRMANSRRSDAEVRDMLRRAVETLDEQAAAMVAKMREKERH